MKTLSATELAKALKLHAARLRGDAGGVRADLSRADLSCAYLGNALLTNTTLPGVFQASAGKHLLTVYDGIAWIGCIKMPLKSLLRNYRKIGAERGYSKAEIAVYGELLKLAAKHQSRVKRGIK
jgi:hypothetical protein